MAFTPLGIFIAMIFIGIPFVVRTVQPVLLDLDAELEEAAACLGANRWQTITRVILPSLTPAILTGFALAFARAVGEYGSVIFIAGNLPNVSEIAPLLIVIRLAEFRYADATAIAVIMLLVSFLIIFLLNRLAELGAGPVADGGLGHDRDDRHIRRALCGCGQGDRGGAPRQPRRAVAGALADHRLRDELPHAVRRACRWCWCSPRRLSKGIGFYLAALSDPEALAAIRLTLIDRG